MYPVSGELVTIVGSSYFQPIADLLSRLSHVKLSDNNDVQVGGMENGYSVSIILLAVAMFESYAMRVRYINRATLPIKRISVIDYLCKLIPEFPLRSELTEVFVLRDLVAHNHLWEIDFEWTEEPGMRLLAATREATAGDTKYHGAIDQGLHVTKTLGLNVFPTKIGRRDVKQILNVVWDALIYLEKKNRNQCYVSHLRVVAAGKRMLFGEVLKKFE